MAGVEPYSPCPCGSGEKFKWCCHKVEAYADKARRLFEGGQTEAAIKAIDEGLRKEPGNPWLLTRKAVMQLQLGDDEPAKVTLRQVLHKNPKHIGALVLLTRCVLQTEGPVNAAGMFQETFRSVEEANRPQLAGLAHLIGSMLGAANHIPAAIKHFDLVARLGDPERTVGSALRSIESNPRVSPWLKDRLELASPPEHLDDDSKRRFREALGLASAGLWAPAAGIFDHLAGRDQGGEADYNLGLCRLWLGDDPGAAGPLRRRSRRLGHTTEAVDLEVLAQLIEPIHPDDRVEHVQLTWPLRNREALLQTLRSKPDVYDDGPTPSDPTDPESPEADTFALLDRPRLEDQDGKGLKADQVPRILGRLSVGADVVGLQTYDDGRVDSLGDRFTALAGISIAPAHPRTKVLGEESRASLALTWDWLFPEGIERDEAIRLDLEQRIRMLRETWPVTPLPSLGFRTPEQVAGDPQAAITLRAALCQFEEERELQTAGLDFASLRARLKIDPEPTIAPENVDIARIPLARLRGVPADRLDDDRLVLYYRRARRAMITEAMEAAALAIIARPQLFANDRVESVSVFTDLASIATSRGQKEQAQSWLSQGRAADSPSRRGPNAPLWDLVEVRLKARSEPPEVWVPELAIVLERYGEDPNANQLILLHLVELGLVRVTPNPDQPDDFLLDTRPLQAVLAQYGPRVTTASGRLGISATKPDLWTPGGPASGPGGAIWTPGSGSGTKPPDDKPKLIITGR